MTNFRPTSLLKAFLKDSNNISYIFHHIIPQIKNSLEFNMSFLGLQNIKIS